MRGGYTSSLAAEAYVVVCQRILRGELVLGQAISRRKLAAELGMSFLPVSEALLRLEFEGLLESRPRAGTRVRLPSVADVEGHYVVREALEVQAAILASAVATPSDRAELRRLAARVDTLALKPDRVMYLTLHQKLHHRIAEASKCAALTTAIEQSHLLGSIWFCAMKNPSSDGSSTRHQDLIEDILAGDAARAAAAVRAHLDGSRAHTLEMLEPYFRLREASGARFSRGDREQRFVAE